MKKVLFILSIFVLSLSCKDREVSIEVGEPVIIVQGIRPEEKLWGPYQFPRPWRMGNRILVSVHVSDDEITSYADPYRWFESRDDGKTWREMDASVADSVGVLLPCGDRISIPVQNSRILEGWTFTGFEYKTPDYDFSVPAEEGVFPVPDGARADIFGNNVVYTYRSERLAPSLRSAFWQLKRISPEGTISEETVPVDWPGLCRVVHAKVGFKDPVLKDIFPRGDMKVGPDGAVWVTAFSGEGHVDPSNGCYSPYYSAELFRSEDDGRHFSQMAHMEYPADGTPEYPYKSGGFSDSDIAFMPDGSILWFMRSNWHKTTGDEWSPMYWTRSEDNGKTWCKPVIFAPCGTLPRLLSLESGVCLLVYGRPGIFLQATADKSGSKWTAPLEVLSSHDRSSLANVVKTPPAFHDYDGAGGNPGIIATGPDTALLIYSDFYVPDESGVKRKSILCREIRVKTSNQ